MVTVLKSEGGTQIISANLQKTIQSIKEIVGNHSDSDIYNALKESNMDPDETAQKLLNQDPFHEVRRRRDKKKENAVYSGSVEPRRRTEYVGQGAKFYGSDRNARRGGYTRSAVYDAGISKEFRVVRDNRVNQDSDREGKVSTQVSSCVNVQQSNFTENSASLAASNQRHLAGRDAQTLNGVADVRTKLTRAINSNTRKEHLDERKSVATGSVSQVSMMKSSDSQSGSPGSLNAVGVYASASDPVHVPSPDSRSSAAIGAIRREVGVVGGRRQSSDGTSKQSFQQSISNLNSVLGSSSTTVSLRSMNTVSRNEQSHASVLESAMISSTGSRLGNHFSGRLNQQPVSHQKGVLHSKEWKPKTSQKAIAPSPGVIGSPVKCASMSVDNSKTSDKDVDHLEDKLAQAHIHENQNVIIAQHIRVPENDRCRLTFGSFGDDSVGIENTESAFQASDSVEDEACEPSSSDQQTNVVEDQSRNSGSSSPSGAATENISSEKKDSSGAQNAENYADMSLVQNNATFPDSKSQQHHDSELPSFSSYDPQPVYDIPYFRPSVDDTVRGPGLQSPQEALSPHTANSMPASSIAMMQQQAPMAQMYPQVHVSHFANVMPYRQYIPPLYVPSMVPGYSGNPGYPHLSNGSSYVLMPGGGSSHLPANNLKYGVQQFKPIPAGSPTGFGNFANPTGYAINAPGVVGGPIGLDDCSRLKYKDSNIYVPNPQAETSEVWIQNHRELPGMQSAAYYNMQGQTAHPAYLQSHTGHTSFNTAAVAQSSHMQFPGMYPPQPAAVPNAHHLGAANIGVGVAPGAPGAQVGAYQQPQMSHLNWTTNF